MTWQSWGRYPQSRQHCVAISWQDELGGALQRFSSERQTTLIFGAGRSYGDSCLAQSGQLLALSGMDRILSVDWQQGIIRAEAGVTLRQLLALIVPRGWFLPVTPGTQYVTLGGAIANDVHGKNHHVAGTFGRYVRSLSLLRSDQGIQQVSPTQQAELFRATIGGLGLTGVIVQAEIQLVSIKAACVRIYSQRFNRLDDFFYLSAVAERQHSYCVAWLDCTDASGRGVFYAGDFADDGPLQVMPEPKLAVPFELPCSIVNQLTLRCFNSLYWHAASADSQVSVEHYGSFFYPLDGIRYWNRLYGPQGFQQYQVVIPTACEQDALAAMLKEIAATGEGSALVVLKRCGLLAGAGLLSFPIAGTSLALDFPRRPSTDKLFHRLDAIVGDAGGRVYPAKDSHCSAADFQRAYPQWRQLEALRDPVLMSHFWARVTR